MSDEFGYALAFLTGLAGALHCLGMCSGLAAGFGALCGVRPSLAVPALYHAVRLGVYTVLGAVGAALGSALVQTGLFGKGQGVLMILAGIAVISIGVHLGLGGGAAQPACNVSVKPLRRHVGVPRHRLVASALGGLINGLVPCSLVFSVALKATATADPARGALLMVIFGLGTLPAMFAVSALASLLGTRLRGCWPRRLLGLTVVILGVWTLYEGWVFFDVMRGLAG